MHNRTLATNRKQNKYHDRLKVKAAAVVATMRDGQTLHRHNAWHRPIWWLSKGGTHIDDEVAQLVIKDPAVVALGDALPLGTDIPAQTFRYAE